MQNERDSFHRPLLHKFVPPCFETIARSVTHAQRMVRALEQCGIRSFLFRAPAGLTGSGCSYAVKVRGQWQQEAQTCLQTAGLTPLGIYERTDSGWQEAGT